MRIENWSVVASRDPYAAPECQVRRLSGKVFGHPRFADGVQCTTSRIKKVNGNQVTTRNGSVYTLGEPAASFVEWCREKGCHVPTPKTPILA